MDQKTKCVVKKNTKSTEASEPVNSTHVQLLLSYVYILSEKMSTITCGYCPRSFEPVVLLQSLNRPAVRISGFDFLQFFNVGQGFVDFMENDCFSKTLHLNTFTIVPCKNQHIIIYSNSKIHHKIKLDLTELKFLLSIQDFLRSLIFEYVSNITSVKTYFDTYLEICKKSNLLELKIDNYFTPILTKKLDFYRLYIELPQICSEQIHCEVSKAIYNKK